MTAQPFSKLLTHAAPGEFRAALLLNDGRPAALFSRRWEGVGERARYGDTESARLRTFADQMHGAFIELASGEEAFLRLKDRRGLTEGVEIAVEVRSEARREKLARAVLTDRRVETGSAYTRWRSSFLGDGAISEIEDRDGVTAAFDDARAPEITLQGGGRLTIERTRALTAFDIDTAGRDSKGSAGARALSVNLAAAAEMVRQVSLRGLGGNLVLDCVSPLNAGSKDKLRASTLKAFDMLKVAGARVLQPSALGLLEASIPWRFMPLEDQLSADPDETRLLAILRGLQREAAAKPMELFKLSLGGGIWGAYLRRKSEVISALAKSFGARVEIVESPDQSSEILKR